LRFPWVEVLQAIGSEVAAETNRSAVMNAPARAVAALRVELKDMNILRPLNFVVRPDHRATQHTLQGSCQFGKVVTFQWLSRATSKNSWSISPPVSRNRQWN